MEVYCRVLSFGGGAPACGVVAGRWAQEGWMVARL